ncbi:hypothetical protein QN277_022936 [Acacia crassicarpa]|uniref:GATA-type domain-containing protein n=1 Tax=Acacia crassicarpa TaxID=499986 RepID=A0AAE1MLI1_9FABA|nr:hypothetical protein QN277_022936 [Acacia crassicarpa]
MVSPNAFHNDGLSNYPYNGDLNTANSYSSNNPSHSLLPPPQKPFHHHYNGSSLANTHFNNFPSLLRPDSTVNNQSIAIPYADVPEQEWLSEFLYSSFNDNFSGTSETTALEGFSVAQSDALFTSKADQKGSRASSGKSRPKTESKGGSSSSSEKGSGTRRCTHCAADDTPQWRSGPLGPKTLCNACGVRYKSGRLVPEYRPASSPTFEFSQHSNSHRKVLELRRQKELMIKQEMPSNSHRKVLELRRQEELMIKQEMPFKL